MMILGLLCDQLTSFCPIYKWINYDTWNYQNQRQRSFEQSNIQKSWEIKNHRFLIFRRNENLWHLIKELHWRWFIWTHWTFPSFKSYQQKDRFILLFSLSQKWLKSTLKIVLQENYLNLVNKYKDWIFINIKKRILLKNKSFQIIGKEET